MKKTILRCMGLALCLLPVLFAGCGDKEKEKEQSGSGGNGTELRGALEGLVTDQVTDAVIAQASVELLPTGRKTQTDKAGAFSFTDLKSGSYQLQVRKAGYAVYTSGDISVSSGRTVKHHVALAAEQGDLQILDAGGAALDVLDLGRARRGVFRLKNAGSDIVEWEIPTLAEAWITGFSKARGKLAPGASEEIEITIDRGKLSEGANEAVVYIGSTAGNKQFKVRADGLSSDIAMVFVEGGTFMMGCTAEQGGDCYSDESPSHSVTLDGFYIGQYEVTQAQWEAVMGTNPCSSSYGLGDDYPVYNVSWTEAQEFCTKLSQKTGKTYRLPTEAEWEYAARGGQSNDGTKYAGNNTIGEVAWYDGNSGSRTHPVGQKQPNSLGLYDMSGNVWEWCQDWYGSYSSSSATNPQGPSSGSSRVRRGGSWLNGAQLCRVSCRGGSDPGNWDSYLGFRVVCER